MLKIVTEKSESINLDDVVKEGAKKMLQQALQLEVEEYINNHQSLIDDSGHRLVVKNGSSKSRKITTAAGAIEIKTPRVNDKRDGFKFSSNLLPAYIRRSPKIESLIPALYLSGVSTNKFDKILKDHFSQGLSAGSISKLKRRWEEEYQVWKKSKITDEFVYLWADGVNVSIRIGEDKRLNLLVIMGVTQDGEKKLLAVEAGYRESKESWLVVLRSLIARGLNCPLLAIADGALGFWSALESLEEFKKTKHQRCWVHKIANVLDKCPKKLQPAIKSQLHEMMRAPDKETATKIKNNFSKAYENKYPKMVTCLTKNWNELNNFFDFPAAHWRSIRTSNPIESSFAGVKSRLKSTKGAGSINSATAMTFKLLKQCESHWLRLCGVKEFTKLLNGVAYKDGIIVEDKKTEKVVAG
ncbi:MAG: IS256 family transposase [Bdellovibrionaceae bacterium]|nr:IS256 family transposase [Pseudobdellovibrionaceae bacterium]MCB9026871.1 IS256 family transposase [Pseudobdellovibrionaceae bacterium]MCB9026931.1 IS256 family transposase [Pseudobdellovibrionaceae bacterium]